jgi:phosphohistidine phosphatase
MEIYILRHGIAEEGAPGHPDSERRLTPEGKEKLRTILACARKAGVKPAVVLSSPYVRAKETAEIARQELKLSGTIHETNALTPMEHPEKVWTEVRAHQDAAQLLVVGHEPLLSGLIAYLIGGGAIDLKKGALARVDVASLGPHPHGALIWLLTAKLAGA